MDRERVEETYRRIHVRLWPSLVSYCGDPGIAGEAASEAFAQAIRRGSSIKSVEKWVWRASFRIADGMLAKRRVRRTIESTTTTEPICDESTAEFIALLGALTSQQRACVVLRYVGQFDVGGIARLLDTSQGTVRVQLHRAHAALRISLADSDSGFEFEERAGGST